MKLCFSFRRHAAFGSVKSEKKGGKVHKSTSFEWVLGMNTAAKIKHKAAFANVFVIVDTFFPSK